MRTASPSFIYALSLLKVRFNKHENEIIVQVKHFLNSGISQLKSELKKNEINKIKDLKE